MKSNYYSFPEMVESLKNVYQDNIEKGIEQAQVTSLSSFSDDRWDYTEHIKNPNSQGSYGVIYWDYPLNNKDSFSDARYRYLRTSSKELIYAIALKPRKKPQAPVSLNKTASDLRFFVNWCVNNEILKFSSLTKDDLSRWVLYAKKQKKHPLTTIARLTVVGNLWQYRDYLSDTVAFDPLSGRTGFDISGMNKEDIVLNKYDFIPESVVQGLVSISMQWIREKGKEICEINELVGSLVLDQIKLGRSRASITRAKRKLLNNTGYTVQSLSYESRRLMASCYVILNLFTGVRASEMLSFRRGKIIKERDGIWIYGEQFKIQHKQKKWMAPLIVYEAYEVLEKLTKPLSRLISWEIECRHSLSIKTGTPLNSAEKAELDKLEDLKEHIFLIYSSRRLYVADFQYVPAISYPNRTIVKSLKDLVKEADLRDDDGALWNLHPHQFRKTFVRFMAANQMNVRYLQEHLGHASASMTTWYDTDDLELNKGIQDALVELKSEIFFNLLESDNYTGAAKENLDKEKEQYFSGLVSHEKKRKFANELASEVSLRNTGHSYCLSDVDNGNCSGVMACMVDIEQTKVCKSALIAKEHLPKWKQHWQNHKDLLGQNLVGEQYSAHVEKVLVEVIEPVINIFSDDNE